MNDKTKTLLCFIIVIACVVVYIAFLCLPTIDEIIDKCKAKKENNKLSSNIPQNVIN